jgi:periplasmic protein CpxP/Spy
MRTRLGMGALAMGAALLTALSVTPVWADKDGQHGKGGEYEKGEYGHGGGSGKEGYGGSHGMPGMGMMMHASTGHMLRHMLKHEKEIGLNADQVTKLKQLQLDLDKTRIKSEADIMIAQREVKAMVEDDKSDLSAIEAKLKQSEDQEVALRMAAIKTRREAMGLLTPEQREKEKAIHDKMMQEHKGMMGGHSDGAKAPHK